MRRPLFAVSFLVVFCVVLYFTLHPDGEKEPPDRSVLFVYGEVIGKEEDSFVVRCCRIPQGKYDNLPSDKANPMNAAIPRQENQEIQYYNGSYKKLQCEYEKAEDLILGCRILLGGEFRGYGPAGNPGEFDYASYYHSMDFGGKMQNVQILWREDIKPGLREELDRLRRFWEKRLYSIFPEKEASVMTAMLLGDKTDLDPDLKTLYRKAGVIHILSISGLHITIIGVGLYNRLRKLGVPMWFAALAGAVLLFLYGMLTGFGISACRAIGMYMIRMLSHMIGRTYDMQTALGVTAAVMLCVHPAWIGHMGFLLSFTSVLGVAVLLPGLQEQFALWQKEIRDQKPPRPVRYVEEPWKKLLLELSQQGAALLKQGFAAGMSVTLTTLPIQLWFSYEISVYSLFLNLLVLPLMGVVLVAGLTAMLIPGSGIVGTVDLLILALYEKLCLVSGRLPYAMWNPGRPAVWQMVLYYLLWIMAVCGLPFVSKKAVKFRPRQFGIAVLLLGTAVGVLCFPRVKETQMTFLDVGQGDGMCLQMSSGEVYLFDCGSSSRQKIGEKVLLPYLKFYGISEVDAVFLSHPDADHVNGVQELFTLADEEHIRIRQVVLPDLTETVVQEEFTEVLDAVAQMKDPPAVTAIRSGMTWQSRGKADTAVTFLCLHPTGIGECDRNTNACSECFCITFPTGRSAVQSAGRSGGHPDGKPGGMSGGQEACVRMLLTGDVEGTGEQELIGTLKRYGISDIDILKCPHHGSKGTTSMELLTQITPTVTVVSCGKNNRYGHPHAELLDRLDSVHSSVYRTDQTGAVTVKLQKDGYRILTYR